MKRFLIATAAGTITAAVVLVEICRGFDVYRQRIEPRPGHRWTGGTA